MRRIQCKMMIEKDEDRMMDKQYESTAVGLCPFVENSREVVFFITPEGVIRVGNQAVREKLGWAPETLVDTSFFDLLHDDDVAELKAALESLSGENDDQSSLTIESRLRSHNDSWLLFSLRLTQADVMPWGAGLIVNALDISELRRLEHNLDTAMKNDSLAELVGSAAHDFNNYLMVIINSAMMAESFVEADSEVGVEIGEIRNAAASAHELTQKLLTKSREAREGFGIVDLNKLLIECGSMLRRIATRPGSDIKVQVEINPDAVICRADRAQLKQILINLVSNAHDAIDESGVITLSLENRTLARQKKVGDHALAKGDYCVIHVKDTGKGMTPEVAEHVFERFFSTKPDTHGTGIGLATVKEIVEGHHGAIDLISAPGKGTEFHIFIPSVM